MKFKIRLDLPPNNGVPPPKKLTPEEHYIEMEQANQIDQYVFDKIEEITKEMKVKFSREGPYGVALELFSVYFTHATMVSYINYHGLDSLDKKVQDKGLKLALRSLKNAIQSFFET